MFELSKTRWGVDQSNGICRRGGGITGRDSPKDANRSQFRERRIEGEARIEGAKRPSIEGKARSEGAARDRSGEGLGEPLRRKFSKIELETVQSGVHLKQKSIFYCFIVWIVPKFKIV